MRKGFLLVGSLFFTIGTSLGLYASQRNCLVAFLTTGHMSFWTGIDILAGFIALAGLVINLVGFISREKIGEWLKRKEKFFL